MNDNRLAWALMYTALPVVLQLTYWQQAAESGREEEQNTKEARLCCVKDRVRVERGV